MKLEDLCARFAGLELPRAAEREHPERAVVEQARCEVRAALLDDRQFLTDCIEHELRVLASGAVRQGLATFFVMPELGVRVAFGYWPPGGGPGPHEHTAWTITAVCHNQLDVATFDRPESYRRGELVSKNRFTAMAGQVGYIFEPSIHAPKNTSNQWSLSLHVTSPRDGEPIPGIEPIPAIRTVWRSDGREAEHPYASVVAARERQRYIKLLVRSLCEDDSPAARSLLSTCFWLGSSSTRREIDRLIVVPDRQDWRPSSGILTRAHRDLALELRREGDRCAMVVQTPVGERTEFVVNGVAHDALAFAATQASFAVSALPGGLSEDECVAVAEMLEDTGLFARSTERDSSTTSRATARRV